MCRKKPPNLLFAHYSDSINDVDAVGKIFIGIYMMFFSTLLCVFELVEIRPIESVDHFMKRNFGFLYGAMGKSFFIIL